jgi:hypothetical protein
MKKTGRPVTLRQLPDLLDFLSQAQEVIGNGMKLFVTGLRPIRLDRLVRELQQPTPDEKVED